MKKVLFTAVAVLGFTFANAQEEATTSTGFAKGDMFVSGSLGFDSSKTGDFKSSEFSIAPSFNYFVTENISVGAKIGYSSASDAIISGFAGIDLGGNFAADYSALAFGVMGRYYFTPASQFSLFGQLGFDYGTTTLDKLDGMSIDSDNKFNSFNVAAGLGMNYFVSSRFSLEAGLGLLGYNSSKLDAPGMESTNSFSFGGDLTNITFGVNYKF